MLNSKIGKVQRAWERIKGLPERKSTEDRISPILIKNLFLTLYSSIKSVTNNVLLQDNSRRII